MRNIMVYGGFSTKPHTDGDHNFFVVRLPEGKLPWSKKVAPAIDRLVRAFYPPATKKADRYWNVDGEPEHQDLWEMTKKAGVLRYEWHAGDERLVEINK